MSKYTIFSLTITLLWTTLSACPSRNAGEIRLMNVEDALVDHQLIDPPLLQPHHVAYNASIAQVQNQYIMAFRVDATANAATGAQSQHLAVVPLDENFAPEGPYELLPTPHELGAYPSAEDPRLLSVNDVPYVIYNAAVFSGPRPGRRMYVARLAIHKDAAGQRKISLEAAKEIYRVHPGSVVRRVEKNWTPFVYDGQLHLIYETNPPRVYRLDLATLDDDGAWAVAHFVSQCEVQANFSFGAMRGGTPAMYAPELDQYISFFHGAQNANFGIGKQTYYMMGAYTFDKKPPFTIRSITQDPLEIPEPDARPVGSSRIVYPQGLVDNGNTYVVSYGRNDTSIFVLKFDKQGIYERLLPVR